MIRHQTLTAIIPVRGGSKGIPGKNLYRLGKDTLLERTIKLAKNCRYIDRVLVTTDHQEMYEIAQSYGVATPAPRPAHLASDTARTIDVVCDVIHKSAIDTGYVMLLQVTSPLRTLADLNACCQAFDEADAATDAIVSLTEHDAPHPNKIQKIENGRVASYMGEESGIARQLLPKVYQLNGAFYLTHRDVLLTKKTFMPAQTMPFIMPAERSLNLDNARDIFLLEALMEKGEISLEELCIVP